MQKRLDRSQYCSVRTPTCCESRDDECTAPILGDHLCYCDMFCDRGPDGGMPLITYVSIFELQQLNVAGNDCCPDFEATCRGGPPQHQADLNGQECISNGVRYNEGESIEQNCQTW
ncbi:hypothetical protein ANCCEY_10271 [Ancylostoma ceylanicum]|uniref:Uncharacterized protein n=1 Tax=Ancylostoma ceylanicum TaxID=53326 RepID=A0A0D6LSL3_9BILA|nr:hypothetical protein ANCCEY_10271 [Ancylostoma ceylanicum]